MARSSLAFQTIRNQAPSRLAENEVRSIHGSASHRVREYKENYWEALHKIMVKKFGEDYLSNSNNILIFPELGVEAQNLLTKRLSEKKTVIEKNQDESQKKQQEQKGVFGCISQNLDQPTLFPDNLLGPISTKKVKKINFGKPEVKEALVKKTESKIEEVKKTDIENLEPKKEEIEKEEVKKIEVEKSETKKEKLTLLNGSQKMVFGWLDIFLNLISNPAILFHGIFIAAFTSLLVYLQKDFYVQAEGKAEIVAYSIAILCELALVLMVFIKAKSWLKAVKNFTLGILFLYVGCCLGFTVWQSATEKRVEINPNIFSDVESQRLKESVSRAEAARSKVSSRDGATAMENARKNVQLAHSRLDLYSKSHKKIPEALRVNQETNVIFQAVLLILLRLIFMGVNGVLAHSLRNVWDNRNLKLN